MTPSRLRLLCNVYPPFLFAGIRVETIAADWSYLRVRARLRWYNRNYVGTQFGGTLFAMADPFYMILLMNRLGRDYIVWDKAGTIDFVAPGRGDVVAEFPLSQDTVDAVRADVDRDGKVLRWFEIDIRALDGSLIARVRKQVHVRRKRSADLPRSD